MPKAFVGEPFWSVTSFGYRKTLCLRGFSRDLLTKYFSLVVPKNIVGETFCVPPNFWYRKTFSITEGGWQGGSFTNLFKNFFSDSAEKLGRGTLLCFRKFLVSEKVKDKRGGKYHVFPSKLYCLTVPNHIVEEHFSISENFPYRKNLCLRGDYHDFLSLFSSHCTEDVRRGTLLCSVSESFRYQKNSG